MHANQITIILQHCYTHATVYKLIDRDQTTTAVEAIGVCYGKLGDRLPSASEVVQLYTSNGITSMRSYPPHDDALRALAGTSIGLIIDTGNEQLAGLAASVSNAAAWVKANIQSHSNVNFKYIAVGNEEIGRAHV